MIEIFFVLLGIVYVNRNQFKDDFSFGKDELKLIYQLLCDEFDLLLAGDGDAYKILLYLVESNEESML
jgi:hypothetical protein